MIIPKKSLDRIPYECMSVVEQDKKRGLGTHKTFI